MMSKHYGFFNDDVERDKKAIAVIKAVDDLVDYCQKKYPIFYNAQGKLKPSYELKNIIVKVFKT